MYDALGDVCALAQDVRVGLSWRDAWDMGTPLLVAACGAGVATVSDRAAASIFLPAPEGQGRQQAQKRQEGIEHKIVLPGGSASFSHETVLHQGQRLGWDLRRDLP